MTEPPVGTRFRHTVRVRYFECDQQGVVFHMWYLAYLEDARNALLAAAGYGLPRLLADGLDIQVVHAQLDWRASARWGDELEVEAAVARVSRTSLTLSFVVLVADHEVASAETTYVIVHPGRGAQPLPEPLQSALWLGLLPRPTTSGVQPRRSRLMVPQ